MEAFRNQSEKMIHVCLAGISHEPAEALAQRLKSLTQLDYVFYSDNGSTAIEVALEICWQRASLRGQKQKQLIVGFEHGYHGDTLACMSVGHTGFHDAFKNHFLSAIHLPSPSQPEACLKALRETFETRAAECAGLIIEPLLQAAGGMKVHGEEVLADIHALCRSFDVPMIVDEIAVGLGRCGDMWGSSRSGFVPDILCTSKGLTGGMLPLSATCVSAEMAEVFTEDRQGRNALAHGHTYTGHPLACSVALASLDLIEDPLFLKHCQSLEAMLQEEMPKFEEQIPYVRTRQMGTVGIVECDLPGSGPLLPYYHKMIEKGYFLRPLDNVAYFWPPLTISVEEYREMLMVSRQTLLESGRSKNVG